jgi:tetratricopeptide (TPR) repeat protein
VPAREVLEIRTGLQGASHVQTVAARDWLGRIEEMAKLPDEGRRALGSSYAQEYRAIALERKAAYREAEKIHRAVIETYRRWLGEGHRSAATIYNNLALNLGHQARYAEAMPIYRVALEIRRKVLGEDHRDTAGSYSNVASLLDRRGQHADAEPLHRKARASWRKALGENHPDAARGDHNLAINLEGQRIKPRCAVDVTAPRRAGTFHPWMKTIVPHGSNNHVRNGHSISGYRRRGVGARLDPRQWLSASRRQSLGT